MKGEVGLANLLLCMVLTCDVTTPSGVYSRGVVEICLKVVILAANVASDLVRFHLLSLHSKR
jgi:hypothetical protein